MAGYSNKALFLFQSVIFEHGLVDFFYFLLQGFFSMTAFARGSAYQSISSGGYHSLGLIPVESMLLFGCYQLNHGRIDQTP